MHLRLAEAWILLIVGLGWLSFATDGGLLRAALLGPTGTVGAAMGAAALLMPGDRRIPSWAALSFMLGVYTGSVFGGAISAVMINIPGTPDAVPTMIEGHQLARRGQGGQALGMAIGSSCRTLSTSSSKSV